MRTLCPPLDAPFCARYQNSCDDPCSFDVSEADCILSLQRLLVMVEVAPAVDCVEHDGQAAFFLTIREFLKFGWTAGPSSGFLSRPFPD
jgi:hypothetical protein